MRIPLLLLLTPAAEVARGMPMSHSMYSGLGTGRCAMERSSLRVRKRSSSTLRKRSGDQSAGPFGGGRGGTRSGGRGRGGHRTRP